MESKLRCYHGIKLSTGHTQFCHQARLHQIDHSQINFCKNNFKKKII